MFDYFTFGATTRLQDSTTSYAPSMIEVSPCDTSYLALQTTASSPSESSHSPCSMYDSLLASLDSESINFVQDVNDCYSSFSASRFTLCSPSAHFSSDLNMYLEIDHSPTGARSSTPPTLQRRLQRQRTSALQCSASHLKSIESLVGKMLETTSQCNIGSPKSCLSSLSSSVNMNAGTLIPSRSTPSLPQSLDFSTSPLASPDNDIDEGFSEPAECELTTADTVGVEAIDSVRVKEALVRLRTAVRPSGIRRHEAVPRHWREAGPPRVRKRVAMQKVNERPIGFVERSDAQLVV